MSEQNPLRRDVLALIGALAALSCGGSRGPAIHRSEREEVDPLKLDPIIDLIPAAGLIWLIEAHPRDILASPVLGPVVATLIPGSRFDRFARHHGGIDIRGVEQIAIASYPQATLVGARVRFDAQRVEAAFSARVADVEGRSVERGVTRVWGRVTGAREQVALLAREAFVFERGQLGPLQAAVYFAQGRLRRSLPALRAEPLASAAPLVGEAPFRVFAPGPFEEQWGRGIAGLLRATTAVAGAARPVSDAPDAAIRLRLLLVGGWGEDAPAAAARLRSAFGVFAEDPFGRLTGMDHPVEGPTISADPGALKLDVTLDAMSLARGLHAATDASLAEIMAY